VKQAKILALDTSTQACTVALKLAGTIEEVFEIIPRQHNQELLGMIQHILATHSIKSNELDCIAFGCGPGSFTGLRMTVGVVQGLAFGSDIPVIPVSTLACMAQSYYRLNKKQKCLVAMQARQEEIYFGGYVIDDGLMKNALEDSLIEASAARLPSAGEWYGVGSGWQHSAVLETALGQPMAGIDQQVLPHARDLIDLAEREFHAGKTLAAHQARPVYLRETVAQKSS
jgi:tRNA threonylcarbamoyladenosine biosynthesis protein TsaB